MEIDCILCGGCLDICPANCIEIIRVNPSSVSDKSLITNQNLSDNPNGDILLLIKKDENCIRCGLCVKRCPVGSFIMEEEIEI